GGGASGRNPAHALLRQRAHPGYQRGARRRRARPPALRGPAPPLGAAERSCAVGGNRLARGVRAPAASTHAWNRGGEPPGAGRARAADDPGRRILHGAKIRGGTEKTRATRTGFASTGEDTAEVSPTLQTFPDAVPKPRKVVDFLRKRNSTDTGAGSHGHLRV